MNPNQWRLRDAKTQLCQVVEAALLGNGKQAVVVLSEQAFESLQRSAEVAAPGFIAHLLAMTKGGSKGSNTGE